MVFYIVATGFPSYDEKDNERATNDATTFAGRKNGNVYKINVSRKQNNFLCRLTRQSSRLVLSIS
jgi:hypothetical protein